MSTIYDKQIAKQNEIGYVTDCGSLKERLTIEFKTISCTVLARTQNIINKHKNASLERFIYQNAHL